MEIQCIARSNLNAEWRIYIKHGLFGIVQCLWFRSFIFVCYLITRIQADYKMASFVWGMKGFNVMLGIDNKQLCEYISRSARVSIFTRIHGFSILCECSTQQTAVVLLSGVIRFEAFCSFTFI